MITLPQFKIITNIIIDRFEGGYYHPDMMVANPTRFSAYKNSGETMFGLDRHAGHGIFYTTPRKSSDVLINLPNYYNGSYQFRNNASRDFWTLIDSQNARNNWKWNFKGGNLYSQLKALAGEIMFHQYQRYANLYLQTPARNIIEKSPFLMLHFAYATWNGPGRFQNYAKTINNAVANGITNVDELSKMAIKDRLDSTNPIINSGGKKFAAIYEEMKKNITSPSSDSNVGLSIIAFASLTILFIGIAKLA